MFHLNLGDKIIYSLYHKAQVFMELLWSEASQSLSGIAGPHIRRLSARISAR